MHLYHCLCLAMLFQRDASYLLYLVQCKIFGCIKLESAIDDHRKKINSLYNL